MKEIPLTQGKVALVDDDIYDYLRQWKWYAVKIWYSNSRNKKHFVWLGNRCQSSRGVVVNVVRWIIARSTV